MASDPCFYPLLYALRKCILGALGLEVFGMGVNNECPVKECLSKRILLEYKKNHIGSSVASLRSSTPITAASAISGWVRSTPSNSEGGTAWGIILAKRFFL